MTTPALARIAALLDAPPEDDDEAIREWCGDFDATLGQRNERWLDDLATFMNGKEASDAPAT